MRLRQVGELMAKRKRRQELGMDGGDWVVLLASPFVLALMAYFVLRYTEIGNLAFFAWLVAGPETIHWLTHNPWGWFILAVLALKLFAKAAAMAGPRLTECICLDEPILLPRKNVMYPQRRKQCDMHPTVRLTIEKPRAPESRESYDEMLERRHTRDWP